jgi:hypothetical protein
MIKGSPSGLSRTGHHTSGPALFMVVIVLSSLRIMAVANMMASMVKQNSGVRHVHGTRLQRVFFLSVR